MTKQYSPIAKITRPALHKVVLRQRLFKLLDERRRYPLTWITGPPGSGKTTLVASYIDERKLPCLWYQMDAGDSDIATFFYYMGMAAKKAAPRTRKPLPHLTPEYLLDVPTFSRRYFENLCSRLKSPFILVFDNYQEVPQESLFHEILCAGLFRIPESIQVIAMSRAEHPPAFTGMLADNRMNVIGWDDIKFTPAESSGMMRLQVKERRDKETISWVYEKTQGWAAGLVLLAKAAKAETIEHHALTTIAPEKVFDYFASELFDRKTDETTRDFLLKTAVLPKMTPSIAERLTGNKDAGMILAGLNRMNYFTEKRLSPELSYLYHPLFRKFLLSRAIHTYPQTTRTHLQLTAAKLLEESGQIEDAASLLIGAGDWNGLVRLILGSAQSLVAQGRNKTLEEWLTSVPGEILSRNPWLQYWLGTCLTPYDSNEAIRYFQKAFDLFDGEKNKEGVFLSWAAIAGAIYFSFEDLKRLNGYIGILDELIEKYGEIPSGEIDAAVTAGMIVAIIMSGEHPTVDQWQEHALSVIEKVPDGNTRLLCMGQYFYYRVLCGDYEGATRMLRQMNEMMRRCECGILMRLKIKIIEAMLYTYSARYEECLKIVTEGLALAEKSGVHALDMILMGQIVWCSITMNVPDTARKFLVRMETSLENARTWDLTCYYLFSAFEALERKDPGKASQHAREAYALSQKVGAATTNYWCSLFLAVTLEECGDRKSALAQFKEAYDHAARWKAPFFTFDYLLSETWFLFRQEKETEGLSSLKKALRIGREHGFLSSFTWRHSMLGELFARALSEGIEVEYVRGLIRRHNLLPPFDKGGTAGILIDAWPWPIKIYTLGRFQVMRDEKPLSFSGRVHGKPLEMLKALAAFSGKDVREELVVDALWPDAEGHVGHTSFKTTLHRLRQLLGREDAIQVHEGRATLNPQCVWVDAWAFDMLLQRAEEQLRISDFGFRIENAKGHKQKSAIHNPQSAIEKAISLYHGHFLSNEEAMPWVVSMQERLKEKFLRAVELLGTFWEQQGGLKKAAACYQQGLDIDDLAEGLYQRLMACYARLGRRAEAVKTYERCRKTLSAVLGVEPSEETGALYDKIVGRG